MNPPALGAPRSVCAALATLCAALAPGAAQTLFASHETLELRLETDLRTLLRDRGDDRQEHDAHLSYADSAGRLVSLDIEVRTRGNFRLRRSTCSFPPLRLDFPKKRTAGTVFEGEDKVKLVTHCRNGRSYEQAVLHEHLTYRILNLLTDKSYRSRLARVTYVDTTGREDSLTRYAVLRESDEAVARRNGLHPVDARLHDEWTHFEQMGIVAVFQYLIGNTDWSVPAMHNITLFRDSTTGDVYAVPFDFDWSGVISAPYATPNPIVGTRTVRERVYRGYCRTEEQMAPVLERFNAVRDSIYALYRTQEGLEPKEVERTLKYFDECYETINDPGRRRRALHDRCRADT